MSVVRQGNLGATRICPHCKATVLQSASICPGCRHHLRFNAVTSEPQSQGVPAMRIEGTIHHPGRGEPCEYCVVIAITNEQGEKIARQVVGVGALQPGERHKYSFSVDVIPRLAAPASPRPTASASPSPAVPASPRPAASASPNPAVPASPRPAAPASPTATDRRDRPS